MLAAFGALVAAIAVLVLVRFKDPRAFRLDLTVAAVLVAMGLLMRMGRKKAPPTCS